MKSLRVKTYTVSNQKQLQATLEAMYFWTMPIPEDPPKIAVAFAIFCPTEPTIAITIFILCSVEPSHNSQRFEKKDPLYRFVQEVDDSTAVRLVPRYQVVSLDYKPVQ